MVFLGCSQGSKGSLPEELSNGEGTDLLSEQQIARSWRLLFSGPNITEETFVKAEALLEELRPENPLRHRLAAELEELRRLRSQQPKRRRARARR